MRCLRDELQSALHKNSIVKGLEPLHDLFTPFLLKLDCQAAAHWDFEIHFAHEVRFQIRDQFWIPKQKLHGACYLIFCKTPKYACLTSRRILAFSGVFRHSIGPLSLKSFFYRVGTIVRVLRA